MDAYQRLKEKFDNKERIIATSCIVLNSTVLIEEMARRNDVDFILIDNEHGVFDAQIAIPCLQTLRLMNKPSIVRVADAEYHLVARIMDMGADGVMIPRTETVEQLQRAVDGLHFPPIGRKGKGGHGHLRYGERFEDYAKTRFLLPQIESRKGIDNLPAMLETFGDIISSVVIGPYDLSISIGTPCDIVSKDNLNAIQEVFDICKKYGTSCGIFCENEERAKLFASMGADVLWLGTDMYYFMRGYNQVLDNVKGV